MPMTSPVASASGLPCSLVRRRANSLLLASMASAILVTSLRRSAIGGAAHAGKAALAAATAVSSWSLEARGHCASTSSVAGLRTGIVRSPGTILPLMRRLKSLIGFALPVERTAFEVSLYPVVYHDFGRGTTPAARQSAQNRAGRWLRHRYILWNITIQRPGV